MTFDEYQDAAKRTAVYPERMKLMYPALGLAGEVGELCNKLKKVYRDCEGQVTDTVRAELIAELGDVLWYVSALATDLDTTLDDAAVVNITKLRDRVNRGTLRGKGDYR